MPVDLIQASEGHYTRLIDLADAVADHSRPKNYLAQRLHALRILSHQKMQLAAPSALRAWRMLYVDACILHCITVLDSSTAGESIGILDQAIIIAGGGDENRLNLILSLINKVQQKFLPSPPHSQKLLNKGHHSSPDPLFTAHREVPTIRSSLSFLSFQSTYSTSPFVIKDYARDWPALKPDAWNSIDYLLSISGPSRLIPVEVGHDYRDENWSQVLMEWETFLHSLDDTTGRPKASQEGLYLAQHNILRQFPALRDDIAIPDYTYCSLNPPDFSGYKAPNNAEGAILNVWLGPHGTMSPAHFVSYPYL
jgi:lysine-specific demethylase 8